MAKSSIVAEPQSDVVTDYATHPAWRGLLAAVIAAPADNLPRLAAADWLEENGYTDRAELIRIQCGVAEGGYKRTVDLFRGENGHAAYWFGPATAMLVDPDFE
jgi:uncharacterized protein (TIGR02996 family)